jgi:G3E family GTPase
MEPKTEKINPDRIIVETSGSAFPGTLHPLSPSVSVLPFFLMRQSLADALSISFAPHLEAPIAIQIRDLKSEGFVLDSIATVIDCVNFLGYEDTSYTAKIQAQFTDVILLNKIELVCLSYLFFFFFAPLFIKLELFFFLFFFSSWHLDSCKKKK